MSDTPLPAPQAEPTPAAKKPGGTWDFIWPTVIAVIVVKFFGLVGGLATIGSYFALKPRIGTWGAVAVSAVAGVVVAVGVRALILL